MNTRKASVVDALLPGNTFIHQVRRTNSAVVAWSMLTIIGKPRCCASAKGVDWFGAHGYFMTLKNKAVSSGTLAGMT
jgi:hypothetical protein